MKKLSEEQLMLKGGLTRCGDGLETAVVESTCAVAGGLIGWALAGGTPIGAVFGAKIGYGLCKFACHAE